MDGTIGVESEPGQGTTFWVEFPVTESPLEIAALPQALPTSLLVTSDPARKVLYIEDNLSNLRLIERLVERRRGLQLIAAHDGLSGLNLARQHRPDLILLDVNLPDIDGHEVILRLRADATRSQVDRLLKAGAIAYLTKPLDVGRFLEILDSMLVAARAHG